MSYGLELRERVIGFVLEGGTMQEAHKTFKVHYNTISKWLNRYWEEGHINPKAAYRQAPYKINWEELESYVKENPDLTQAEYGEHFGVSQAQICRILKALDITYKKKSLTYLEQDQEKVEEFKKLLEELPEETPIVYLDESGIKQEVTREYGYAKRGEELFGKVSGKRTKKLNMIAALCDDEIIAPLVYANNMNTQLFNCYLQIILLPLLAFGTVIVMDNARYHISEETKKLIEKMGCKLILLPPYSPDLNKIENYWAIIKKYVKKYRQDFPSLKDTLSFIFNFIFSPYIFISL